MEDKNTFRLTNEQLEGVIKLINQEIGLNSTTGDDAYNTFWENIKMALGYAVVK